MNENDDNEIILRKKLEEAEKEIDNLREELTETNKGIIALYNDLDSTNEQIKKKNVELNNALLQLQEAQDKLIHSEKMAAIGAMVVTLNHEINNPLMVILGSVQLMLMKEDDLNPSLVKNLTQIEFECKRIKEVVHCIRNYTDLIPVEYLNSVMYDLHTEKTNPKNEA
ncbi:hypothetical protein ISS30_08870 [bacterium]|nr:hypothetical protein [FCB group bacterium]MBL7191796.1 hypothetical protein [bacterium]